MVVRTSMVFAVVLCSRSPAVPAEGTASWARQRQTWRHDTVLLRRNYKSIFTIPGELGHNLVLPVAS